MGKIKWKYCLCLPLLSLCRAVCSLSLWQPVSFVTFLNLSHLPTLSSSSSSSPNHLILFMLVFHKYLAGGISKQKQCPHSPNPHLRAKPPPIHYRAQAGCRTGCHCFDVPLHKSVLTQWALTALPPCPDWGPPRLDRNGLRDINELA